jgi:hypothetical protein
MTMPGLEIVFLDIDGVLSDFDAHAKAHNAIKSDGKFNYDALDFKWWSTIPVVSGARAFYDALQATEIDVKFLTGPMVSVECFGGKASWLQNQFLPDRGKWALTDLIICHSKRKDLLAGVGRVLIDDTLANVQAWEAAGGIGIHHKGCFKETTQELKARTGLDLKSFVQDAPKKTPALKPR